VKPRLLLLVPTSTYRAKAFVAAAKRMPVELSIASEVPSALSHLHPVSLPSFDFTDPEAVTAFIRDFALENPIDAVVAVDDQATMAAAMIADALGLPGNPPEAAYATLNKYRTRCVLADKGVPSPQFQLVAIDADVRATARSFDYPVVIKPLMMAASRGVIRVDDASQFTSAFARVSEIVNADDAPQDVQSRANVLVEEYIPGWEVAVEGIVSGGRLDILAIFDKPDPLEGPYFPETIYTTPSRLPAVDRRAVIESTREAVAALGLRHGPVHAELRGRGKEAWIIEVAARSIGGLCSKVLRFDGGRTLEDVILQHALGHISEIPARENEAAGVMMLQAAHEGTLESVDGVEEAEDVKGIDEVIVSAHLGRDLAPLPEGFLYLGFIFARRETPGEVEASLRRAHEMLRVNITPTHITHRRTAL
jgi:biotin carboxylase